MSRLAAGEGRKERLHRALVKRLAPARRLLGKRLRRGSFARDVSVIAGGTAFAQGLALLAAPVLTRLYSPEHYGLVSLYSAVLALLLVFSSLRYELTLPLPEEDEDAVHLVVLCLALAVVMAGIAALVVWLLGEQIAGWVSTPQLRPYLWLVPVATLLVGFYKTFSYWAIRTRNFAGITSSKINQSLSGTAVSVGLGVLGYRPLGLFLAAITRECAGVLTLSRPLWRRHRAQLAAVRYRRLVELARQHWRFPVFSVPAALVQVLSSRAPVLLLGFFFAPTAVGHWALGRQLVRLPMTLIGQSVSQVFLNRAAEASRQGQVGRVSLEIFRALVAVGLAPILIVTIAGPELFATVLGERWREAGVYMQWLAIWQLFVFVSSPLSQLFFVLDRQREGLMLDLVMLAASVASLWIGGYYDNPRLGVALFGASGAVLWGGLCLYILRIAEVRLSQALGALGREAVYALPWVAIVAVAKLLAHDWTIVGAAAVSLATFAVLRGRQLLQADRPSAGSDST